MQVNYFLGYLKLCKDFNSVKKNQKWPAFTYMPLHLFTESVYSW